jgi:hypothetical protein
MKPLNNDVRITNKPAINPQQAVSGTGGRICLAEAELMKLVELAEMLAFPGPLGNVQIRQVLPETAEAAAPPPPKLNIRQLSFNQAQTVEPAANQPLCQQLSGNLALLLELLKNDPDSRKVVVQVAREDQQLRRQTANV